MVIRPISLRFLAAAALLLLPKWAPANTAGTVRPMSALRSLIGRAITAHARQVVIPPGTYRGGPAAGSPVILPLQNVENLQIIALGVKMVCTMRTRAIFFSNCKNVELDGLTIDYDPLTFTQGKVTGIAPDNSSIDVTLDAGYPRLPFERLSLIDSHTRFILPGLPFFWGAKSAMVQPNVVRVTYANVGKSARLGTLATLSDGNEATGICHGVTVEHCRGGMVLSGLTLYCAPGMGIVEANGSGGTKIRNVRIIPGPPPPGGTQPRLLTTSWDGILGVTLGHGDDVENCTIQDCGDDSWSDQSSPLLVVKAGEHQLVLAGDVGLARGDHLRQSLTDKPLTIVGVQKIPIAQAHLDSVTMGRLDKPAQYSLWEIGHDTVQIVTTDRATALDIGSSVYAPEHQGNGFIFRHNKVHSRGRILIKAGDGLIDGNSIVGGHNIVVSPEVPQGGAFGIENLTFTNNRIVLADYTEEMPWSTQAGALCVACADPYSNKRAMAQAGSYKNIVVKDNIFENVSAANIWLAGVSGATIEDNRFVRPHTQPLSSSGTSYRVDNAAVILLRNCDRVTLSGNSVTQPGPYEKTLLSLDASDTRVTTVNGGVPRMIKGALRQSR